MSNINYKPLKQQKDIYKPHEQSQRDRYTAACIGCDVEMKLGKGTEEGEIIDCQDCGIELEVKSIDPIILELAPTTEEDWGE